LFSTAGTVSNTKMGGALGTSLAVSSYVPQTGETNSHQCTGLGHVTDSGHTSSMWPHTSVPYWCICANKFLLCTVHNSYHLPAFNLLWAL